MRVILDTNVYVSMAIRSVALEPLRGAWETKRFSTLISIYLLVEVEAVLKRTKFAPLISKAAAERFLERVAQLGEPTMLKLPHPDFSDPKDRYLLAMLRDSDAELLITGDKTLLALKSFDHKPILPPAGFLARLKE